jgi:hypothetical protein
VGVLPDTDDEGRIYSALDIDSPAKWAEAGVDLPKIGPCQTTGTNEDPEWRKDHPGENRRHHLYWWPAGTNLKLNGPLAGTGAELKGGGLGYIVVEPSATVGPYRWVRTGEVSQAPEELTAILARGPVATGQTFTMKTGHVAPEDVVAGSRHDNIRNHAAWAYRRLDGNASEAIAVARDYNSHLPEPKSDEMC